jgi:hypothetical protein
VGVVVLLIIFKDFFLITKSSKNCRLIRVVALAAISAWILIIGFTNKDDIVDGLSIHNDFYHPEERLRQCSESNMPSEMRQILQKSCDQAAVYIEEGKGIGYMVLTAYRGRVLLSLLLWPPIFLLLLLISDIYKREIIKSKI